MPRTFSTFPKSRFTVWPAKDVESTLPETAATGETLAARLAGDCAARRTVTTPTAAPLSSPIGLTAKTGMELN